MFISTPTHYRLFAITLSLLALLVPGASLLLTGKYKLGLSIPLIGLFWVAALSWSRVVTKPEGFIVLLFGLLALHLVSYTVGFILSMRSSSAASWLKTKGVFVLLCTLNFGISISCHLYKDQWFGFTFYHIPSESMSPTLRTGDIILADTWICHDWLPQRGDIVVFMKDDSLFTKRIFAIEGDYVLIKGIEAIRMKPKSGSPTLIIEHNKVFVLGDNQLKSRDSRYFGAIPSSHIVAKPAYKLFSIKNENFDFKVFGDKL